MDEVGDDDGMDEELGVAVVFQNEENREDMEGGESDLDEVLESDNDEERDPGKSLLQRDEKPSVATGHEDLMQDETSADIVNPKAIDAFWLQRQISAFISDPVEAQTKAEAILCNRLFIAFILLMTFFSSDCGGIHGFTSYGKCPSQDDWI